MRIAHIITRMIIGGAQENTLLTCRGLVEGFADEVTLISGPSDGPEGSLVEEVQAADIPLIVVPSLRRAINPLHDWRALRELKSHLRRLQPDVVHTHSAKGGFLGRLAAHAVGVPTIVHTVHGAPFHEYQGRGARALFRGCERYAAARCHKLISVADAMTYRLVNAGVAERDQFTTIYSGMEMQPFLDAGRLRDATRQRLGYREDDIVVGKVARLFKLKGHADLLDAAPSIVERCPQVKFLLVGDGVLRDSLQQRVKSLGLEDRVHFANLAPPTEIPAMLSAMDIVVHTSLREGLAKVLPQALLAGRPVVSYDIDGAREVVTSGETGFLIPPQDQPALIDAVVQLAGDPSLRSRLAANGRQRCLTMFDHQQMVRKIREVYEELLQ